MFIQTIKYQIVEKGEWLNGWYIGEAENTNKSKLLDENFQPLDYSLIWNWTEDRQNYFKIDVPFERK